MRSIRVKLILPALTEATRPPLAPDQRCMTPLLESRLSPPFFLTAVDDTERAIILLHEAQHLVGYGEDAALERVWRAKHRLGWNAERYGGTKAWNNTREWTQAS